MKRFNVVLIVLFIIFPVYLAAMEAPGFDDCVEFGVSLKELDRMTAEGSLGEIEGKYLVLDGAVTEYTVVDKNEASYTVEVELVNGEWAGVSNVYIYRCIVVFRGREFMEMFPARRKSTPGPNEVPVNAGLIVVARPDGTKKMGNLVVPLLEGYYLRIHN